MKETLRRETNNGGIMRVDTYTTEAKNKLGSLLERTTEDGEVQIKRGDGTTCSAKPADEIGSPLDVEGVEPRITTKEIVEIVQESGSRNYE